MARELDTWVCTFQSGPWHLCCPLAVCLVLLYPVPRLFCLPVSPLQAPLLPVCSSGPVEEEEEQAVLRVWAQGGTMGWDRNGGRKFLILASLPSPGSVSDPAQGSRVCPRTLLQPSVCLHCEPYLRGERGKVGRRQNSKEGSGGRVGWQLRLALYPDPPHQGGS